MDDGYIVGGEDGIRMLIVEDEAPIRNGLIRHMRWQDLGIGEIRVADTAEAALEILPRFRPELVLSDIRMPGMDGTRMAGIVREQLPESQIVFISGYSDKEYLHAAIELGAAGYVEKPIQVKELTKVIQKAVAAIQKSRRISGETLTDLIYNTSSLNVQEEDPSGESVEFGDKEDWQHYVVFLIRTKKPDIQTLNVLSDELVPKLEAMGMYGCSVMSGRVSDRNIALLIRSLFGWSAEKIRAVCRMIVTLSSGADWFVCAGCEHRGRSEVPLAYREAMDALRHLSYKGWGGFAGEGESSADYEGDLTEGEIRTFQNMISEGREREAIFFVNSFAKRLVESRTIMNFQVRSAFHVLDQTIYRVSQTRMGGDERGSLGFSGEDPYMVDTIIELRDLVRGHIHDAVQRMDGQNQVGYQVREVCDYIRGHFSERDLSLGRLSEMVGLSPAYLSSLFSKSMGMTVGQYITEVRVRRAAELLKDPKYKQYEIAEMVGYDDPKYFARLFKNRMGMTVSEYRASL